MSVKTNRYDIFRARAFRANWQNALNKGNDIIIGVSRHKYCQACAPLVSDVDEVKAAQVVLDESRAAYHAVLKSRSEILQEARDAYTAIYEVVKNMTDEDTAIIAGDKAYDKVMKKDKLGPDNYFTLMRTNKAYEDWQVACDEAFLSLYCA